MSLTSVIASLGTVAGATAKVDICEDASGAIGAHVVTLTNPSSLVENALNVWTSTELLDDSTAYWVVFAATAGSYEVNSTPASNGGSGTWLASPLEADYTYRVGNVTDVGNTTTDGALRIAFGATSVPSITSTLTASGTYGSSFSYQITATNTPTSYAATNLPRGLSLNATSGLISGSPAQTGTFSNISLTATNGSTTAPTAAGSYSIGLDRRLQLFGLQLGDVHHLHDVRADLFAGADHQSRHHGRERDIEPLGVQCRAGHGGELRAVQGRCDV